MMPVIRITDATWERLKRWAEPLEDSPEDAVRKVLEAAEEHLKCSNPQTIKTVNIISEKKRRNIGRLQKGLKIPNQAFRRPILDAIYELGGSAPVEDVLRIVEEKMKGLFSEVDYQNLPAGGDIRWCNTAQWERYIMVKDRLLKSDSTRGIWELSDKGFDEINRGKK